MNDRFKLDASFIEGYKHVKPPFGFKGLSELAYIRTYSRLIPELNRNEEWFETIQRVVEGTYTIQRDHIIKYDLGWDKDKAQESAQEMYERMFSMKFLPPGRGLWVMGTDIIHKRKLFAALNNCAYYSTKDIDKAPTKPFEFMMDMSMLGVGVGFDTEGAGKLAIIEPSGTVTYSIPDSREGWVESLKMLLESFVYGKARPIFDYSQLRPKGAIIKTFGGKSAGPDPLEYLHKYIEEKLSSVIGKKLSMTDIVDIMNNIGTCVVAGNVRRTAQIVFGDPNDEEYLNLKNYKINPQRQHYGWTSNNSIQCKVGMDYTKSAERTTINGEPGYFWLENAQDYGRMNGNPDFKDHRATGGNPCLEQTLESAEMCCLVETFPTKADSLEDFLRTLKFAYLYAKTVTLGTTHWSETNRIMLRNRRIGTSVSGIAQFVDKNGLNELKTWLNEGYDTIQHYDEIYSDWLAIPRSIKTTSVKPSGTVSLLPGVTPGLHYPESNFYIRRITIAKNSDLVALCSDAGYKVEQSIYDSSSVLVEIPIKMEGVRTLDEVSMWEQLSLAAFMQEHWSDNQVSCTITFQEGEAKHVKNALNYFQYKLKGVSFLPKLSKGAYAQMPYEQISEETYNARNAVTKSLKLGTVTHNSRPEMYCDGDACTLK